MILIAVIAATSMSQQSASQTPLPGKTYSEEWVYRIRYGYQDEWWQLFRRYELVELDASKRSGEVVGYNVYRASLHTDEAARWDYRVIVTYRDIAATQELRAREAVVIRGLFHDEATYKADTRRRWELTLNHWDLPISEVDPHS